MHAPLDHLFNKRNFCGKYCMQKKHLEHKKNKIPRTITMAKNTTAVKNKITET